MPAAHPGCEDAIRNAGTGVGSLSRAGAPSGERCSRYRRGLSATPASPAHLSASLRDSCVQLRASPGEAGVCSGGGDAEESDEEERRAGRDNEDRASPCTGYAPCCASMHLPQRDAAALPRCSSLTITALCCPASTLTSPVTLPPPPPPSLSESPFAGALPCLERGCARPPPPPDLSPAPHRPRPQRPPPACAAYILTRSAFTPRERHPPCPRFISIDLRLLTSRLHHIDSSSPCTCTSSHLPGIPLPPGTHSFTAR
ncbi:hypothetical protein B0H14DRAFT_1535854 [Mycena olivaceomarginata]|nr:hypothetical protein B0H14DRAFT_1535854 [Mycena olivaceomarginata]